MTSEKIHVSGQERLLAGLGYAGAGPFLALYGRKRALPGIVRHHLHQAAGVWLLLLFVILFYATAVAYISYVILSGVEGPAYGRLEGFALTSGRRLFLAWGVFWCFGVALALLGSDRQMPVAAWLGERRWLRRLSWAAWCMAYALAAVLLPAALYGRSLAPPTAPPHQVVMLYENNGVFPRWLFTLGFLPISRAAKETLGPGQVRVERLTAESLASALEDARFLFIGSHGGQSGLYVEGKYYEPTRLISEEPHPQLEYVYLAGCESGALRAEWERAFSPARVITYDRITAVVEHVWWLWTRGPKVVRRLEPAAEIEP